MNNPIPKNVLQYTKEVDLQNYYWFRNAFSKEDVDKVLDLCSQLEETRAGVIGTEEEDLVRTSIIKWIPKTENFQWIYEKLMALSVTANNEMWNFDLVSSLESIQYTEYYASENGHYGWHQDIGTGELPSKRKVSITIQLSEDDEYEGGDLQICTGGLGDGNLDRTKTCPRGKGVGVLFPSYMMHRVTPVTKGIRKSLVLWVGGSSYR